MSGNAYFRTEWVKMDGDGRACEACHRLVWQPMYVLHASVMRGPLTEANVAVCCECVEAMTPAQRESEGITI